jgi:hypothetical protein
MDIDFSEDDWLGEENELSEAACDFVGVKKGHSVNVRSAASLAAPGSFGTASAPARLPQRPLQLIRSGGKQVMGAQPKMQEERLTSGSSMDQTQQPTKGLVVQAAGAKTTAATEAAALVSQKNLISRLS